MPYIKLKKKKQLYLASLFALMTCKMNKDLKEVGITDNIGITYNFPLKRGRISYSHVRALVLLQEGEGLPSCKGTERRQTIRKPS